MARQTTWGLALLVTCVAAGNGASAGAHQVHPAATQNGAKDTKDKDNKAKPHKHDKHNKDKQHKSHKSGGQRHR